MTKELINDNIYIKIESSEDFDYYVLAKKLTTIHCCADGYFYDPYEKIYLTKSAADYILYYDKAGNKLETPVIVKVEWRPEKDV